MEHICEVCGKVFNSNSKTAKYCSHACNEKAFLERHGCTMSEYRRKLYAKNKKLPDPRPCAVCGKVFTPEREGVEYCSESCRYRRQNILARVKKNNERAKHMDCYGRLQIQCEICGKWFVPKTKDETICTSCKIFRKYAQEHPDLF